MNHAQAVLHQLLHDVQGSLPRPLEAPVQSHTIEAHGISNERILTSTDNDAELKSIGEECPHRDCSETERLKHTYNRRTNLARHYTTRTYTPTSLAETLFNCCAVDFPYKKKCIICREEIPNGYECHTHLRKCVKKSGTPRQIQETTLQWQGFLRKAGEQLNDLLGPIAGAKRQRGPYSESASPRKFRITESFNQNHPRSRPLPTTDGMKHQAIFMRSLLIVLQLLL
jgi:hypothetical protein